ncbi:MAG TPA: alternative ribosome rescue aminoacyl-tRNA hydrolase ArfB [Candidatus Kapabacteria bacterium]|nr:alternative ribosome rescue aminoacyl-tRNA hydrolase ArfB [Candidatus Kapabacteria bacterium]
MIRIPDQEIVIDTVRSSGPGGQNVNKVSSKVQLRWNVGQSSVVSFGQKELIRHALANRMNAEDEVMVDVDEERSQLQNRMIAIDRLQTLVNTALIPKKVRRATRPTRASKERRLDQKRKVGERKRARRMPESLV